MGKYRKAVPEELERKFKVHPIWRGFGALLVLLILVISFSAAKVLVHDSGLINRLPVAGDLTARVRLPVLDYSFLTFPIDFNLLINWLPAGPLLVGDVVLFFVFIFIGFSLMSILYSFLYQRIAPIRGPFDAPEVERQPRRRR
jgi:hypothetical protein